MTENLGRRNSSCLFSFSKCWNYNFEIYVFATLYYATFLCVSSLNFLFNFFFQVYLYVRILVTDSNAGLYNTRWVMSRVALPKKEGMKVSLLLNSQINYNFSH